MNSAVSPALGFPPRAKEKSSSPSVLRKQVRGEATTMRWSGASFESIAHVCQTLRLGGVARSILDLRARQERSARRKGAKGGDWTYTAHQLAAKTRYSRSQVQDQLRRLQSHGLAEQLSPGSRGRGLAGVWAILPIGPSFSEVAAEASERKKAAREKARHQAQKRRYENAGNQPLLPPEKNTQEATSTSSGEGAPMAVAEKVIKEMISQGVGKGGAVTVVRGLKANGLSIQDFEAFGQTIGLVLKAIQEELGGQGSAHAVLVHRVKSGEGRDLLRLGRELKARADRKLAMSNPKASAPREDLGGLLAAWNSAREGLEKAGANPDRNLVKAERACQRELEAALVARLGTEKHLAFLKRQRKLLIGGRDPLTLPTEKCLWFYGKAFEALLETFGLAQSAENGA